jgi:hypothetical protein
MTRTPSPRRSRPMIPMTAHIHLQALAQLRCRDGRRSRRRWWDLRPRRHGPTRHNRSLIQRPLQPLLLYRTPRPNRRIPRKRTLQRQEPLSARPRDHVPKRPILFDRCLRDRVVHVIGKPDRVLPTHCIPEYYTGMTRDTKPLGSNPANRRENQNRSAGDSTLSPPPHAVPWGLGCSPARGTWGSGGPTPHPRTHALDLKLVHHVRGNEMGARSSSLALQRASRACRTYATQRCRLSGPRV